MDVTRCQFKETTGFVALSAAMLGAGAGQAQASDGFDIDAAFATFMTDIGQAPGDGGGKVTFTGKDPLVRSHFHIGATMAIPAMAAGVGAPAV